MVTYQYRCGQCAAHFEAKQRMTDPPYTDCTQCEGKVHRLITGVAFQLIGRGWHVNDYTRRGIK